MIEFTSYDNTGKVVSTGVALNYEEQAPEDGGVYLGLVDGSEYYFVNDEPVLRPELTSILFDSSSLVANNIDTITVTGVPSGALVRFNEDSILSDGSPIELTTNYIGTSKFIVDYFPYKLFVKEIYGTAT